MMPYVRPFTYGPATVSRAIEFHRGLCPLLAIGIQASWAAIEEVGRNDRDHEVMAVAEGDSCAVDAVQVLTGCTLGNRDLIVVDYGKVVFSFWRRSDGKGIRVGVRPEAWEWDPEHIGLFGKVQADHATADEYDRFRALHRIAAERILATAPDSLLTVEAVDDAPPPRPYASRPTIGCTRCREWVVEGKTLVEDGRHVCAPCFFATTR
jgi:formylmethanofuran dehydrogenase subunit E